MNPLSPREANGHERLRLANDPPWQQPLSSRGSWMMVETIGGEGRRGQPCAAGSVLVMLLHRHVLCAMCSIVIRGPTVVFAHDVYARLAPAVFPTSSQPAGQRRQSRQSPARREVVDMLSRVPEVADTVHMMVMAIAASLSPTCLPVCFKVAMGCCPTAQSMS